MRKVERDALGMILNRLPQRKFDRCLKVYMQDCATLSVLDQGLYYTVVCSLMGARQEGDDGVCDDKVLL